MGYEYHAIPAPMRGEKARDAKTPTDRYALALTTELNRMAAGGWEYLRADVLPSEERSGLTGRTTLYHNLLIFRRPVVVAAAPEPLALARPDEAHAEVATPAQSEAAPAPAAPDTAPEK
ncbi:MAG: DUF4177 domain-containing protein [Paracoccus sp. (in: a-proteobacteria)]|uniref:DUF4177 domain-containing protein n=1 Tax=Paracoccus sp. TaxID=267 RepID=UPI003919B720